MRSWAAGGVASGDAEWLTCGDKGHVQINASDSSTDRELRAGTPLRFRIVAIDNSVAGQTKFGLVALELPKDAQ